jgi:HEAT repeats
MVATTNMQARHEFTRALVLIGAREGVPALGRAAAEGEWEIRKIAMDGFTMLGDARDQAAYKMILQHEEDVITSDCRARPILQGCNDQKALLDKMLATVRAYAKRLEAAALCKQDAGCWADDRLKDPDAGVRERALLELARLKGAKALDALFAATSDADGAVRFRAVECLEWLLANDAKARTASQKFLPSLQAQVKQGQGTVAGARFDAPLRRLIFRIQGPQ